MWFKREYRLLECDEDGRPGIPKILCTRSPPVMELVRNVQSIDAELLLSKCLDLNTVMAENLAFSAEAELCPVRSTSASW